MRQVNIKTLQAKLSQEILDLPFEITKKGKVVAIMVHKETTTLERGIYLKKEISNKLTKIIKKKQGTDISETTIVTDVRPVFGYPKSFQARK